MNYQAFRTSVVAISLLGLCVVLPIATGQAQQTTTQPQGVQCAKEHQRCAFEGGGVVYYGAGNIWRVQRHTGGVSCSNGVFGDPVPGVVKSCWVVVDAPKPSTTTPPTAKLPGFNEACDARQLCDSGLKCLNGSCQHWPRRANIACQDTGECAPGLGCVQGRCQAPAAFNQSCSGVHPCAAGLSCDPTSKRCFNAPRLAGQPCSAGISCANGLYCDGLVTGRCVTGTPPPSLTPIDADAPLNAADTKAGVAWIIEMLNLESIPVCWRDSYTRNAGDPLERCEPGQEKSGLLCYPQCKPGFDGVGPTCLQQCSADYTDMGLICSQGGDSYGAPSRVADCPSGYTNNGFTCGRGSDSYGAASRVADCPSGFTNIGLLCSQGSDSYGQSSRVADCPSGFTNMGLTCYRAWPPKSMSTSAMTCRAGEFRTGGRCYRDCKPGYTNIGEVCHRPAKTLTDSSMSCRPGEFKNGVRCYKECKPGYTNVGEACHKPASTLGPEAMSCRPGEFKNGVRCYKECKPGYTNIGEACHRKVSSYSKTSYGRGLGEPMKCAQGQQQNGLLCYDQCKPGYDGAAFVCWRQCPASRPVMCGMACTTTSTECAQRTAEMVIAPIELVVNIAGLVLTGGSANAAKSAAKTAAKAGSKAAIKASAKASVKSVGRQIALKLERKLGPKLTELLVKRGLKVRKGFTKQGFAKNVAIYLFKEGGESIAAAAMAAEEPSLIEHLRDAAALDPTGVAEVVAAYAHPKCGEDPQLPKLSSAED